MEKQFKVLILVVLFLGGLYNIGYGIYQITNTPNMVSPLFLILFGFFVSAGTLTFVDKKVI